MQQKINNKEKAFIISSVAGTRGHQITWVQKTKDKYLCRVLKRKGIRTVGILGVQGFKKELHKFREEKSDGRLVLMKAQELLNCLSLDIRKVVKKNMPLSETSGIRCCWRQDVRQGQPLIFFFFKFLVNFLFATYHKLSLWHSYDTAANAFLLSPPQPGWFT